MAEFADDKKKLLKIFFIIDFIITYYRFYKDKVLDSRVKN